MWRVDDGLGAFPFSPPAVRARQNRAKVLTALMCHIYKQLRDECGKLTTGKLAAAPTTCVSFGRSFHSRLKKPVSQGFIEYGEHGGNYYGTSIDSVRRVLAESKVCLQDVEPHVIKILYTTEFKPYVVFVKPPAMQQLRLSRRRAKILSSRNEPTPMRTFSDADFEDMIKTAQAMENKYGYLFEKIIINDDLALAFTEIRAELARLEKETNWIPKTWAQA
ncbi:hypothetical protein SRHO_G00237660 [Serrasalmus rhombeus]